jgi:hypothetical protein
MMLSARAESIILSAGSTKQQSTKNCSRKCNGGGRSDSGGGNRFDVGIIKDDCRDNSNGDGNSDGDSSNGYSSNDDSNSNSGSSASNSGRKNNNQLKAAAAKAATAIDAALASTV